MDNIIKLKIKYDNYELFIEKILSNNICYKNLIKFDNYCILEVDYRNYDKIKKVFKKFNILKYYGFSGFIKFLKFNYIFIFSIIFSILIIFIMSNVVFKIDIQLNNKEAKELIMEELNKYGIKEYKFKKNFKELKRIKKNIIKTNKDIIDWMEIENVGTKYIVKVNLRIKNENNNEHTISNIIAKKDALIKFVTSASGVILKNKNDYVKKGDIIVTGNIIKGEDTLKGQVPSTGKVYGEVWYLVKTRIPYKYKQYYKTNEEYNHYYIEFFGNKMSLINKYVPKYYKKQNKIIFDKFYIPFKIYKDNYKVYNYKTIKLNKRNSLKLALYESDKKIKSKLNKDEYIISKKVLKKNENSSRIYIEVFYKVFENIALTSEITN